MNKNILIVAGIVIALLLAFPFIAKLAKSGGAAGTATETVANESTATRAGNLPPAWNAGNLAGTAWNVSGYTVNLGAGGVATANTPIGAVSGTWVVNGSTITVEAMGRKIDVQISGDQLLVDGKPAQRVQ